jgi:hypothetical protein
MQSARTVGETVQASQERLSSGHSKALRPWILSFLAYVVKGRTGVPRAPAEFADGQSEDVTPAEMARLATDSAVSSA